MAKVAPTGVTKKNFPKKAQALLVATVNNNAARICVDFSNGVNFSSSTICLTANVNVIKEVAAARFCSQ